MVMVIDFIDTPNVITATTAWQTVSDILADFNGFSDGQLFGSFQTIMPRLNSPLVSACTWTEGTAWDEARIAAKADPRVTHALGAADMKFRSLRSEFVAGQHFTFDGSSSRMVLFDVIYLDPEHANDYAAMWRCAATYMESQPGFRSAGLYRNQDNTDPIKFVNIAEWETSDLFFHAAHTPQFLEIVDPFKDNFALHLTHRVARQTARPHLALRKDVA